MTPEELMRRRVKVENKWPNCPYEVDDILIQDGDYYWLIGDISWHGKILKQDVEPYPYLMRPLEWWEDRTPEEMPEYVKEGDHVFKATWKEGAVTENGKQPMRMQLDDKYGDWQVNSNVMCHFEPAALDEYNAYINKQ